MVGRFRHLTATLTAALTIAALVAGPNALSAASTPVTDADGPTTARIGLAGADPDGLQRFAEAVSDPHSAQYRHFLTPQQVRTKFGPTAAQLKKVHEWLAGGGLTVTGENSHWIDVAGTAAKIRKAFGRLPRPRSNAGEGLAARVAAQVPPALAGAVSSVAGLAPKTHGMRQFSYRVTAGVRRGAVPVVGGDGVNPGGPIKRRLPLDPGDPTLSSTTSTACSSDWGSSPATDVPQGYNKPDPLVVCGYSPKQLRAAYGVTASGFTGKGVVIGVIDAYGSPTMREDANQFAMSVGDKPFGASQYLESVDPEAWKHLGDGECETPAAWGGEEALDVEMAHGLAPAAVVHYFGAASCQDQDIAATLASIVDGHLADTVTGSFGEIMHSSDEDVDPAAIAQEDEIFIAGAAEGIGFAFATGDCGDQAPGLTGPACDPGSARAQVEWPAASPWVTAVGGTALALGPSGTRHWEAPMGDLRSDLSADGSQWEPLPGQFYFGGGGGASGDFGQPAYQKGVVPKDLADMVAGTTAPASTPNPAAVAKRTVPDIAMDGDLMTAVRTGATDPTLGGYGQDVIGGTSVAAPMFAAVQADAMQAAGGALGFANPALYKRAGTRQLTDILDRPRGAPNPISAVVDHGMFGDVREARLFELGADHGLSARKGYDTATGLGSPTAVYITSFKDKGGRGKK